MVTNIWSNVGKYCSLEINREKLISFYLRKGVCQRHCASTPPIPGFRPSPPTQYIGGLPLFLSLSCRNHWTDNNRTVGLKTTQPPGRPRPGVTDLCSSTNLCNSTNPGFPGSPGFITKQANTLPFHGIGDRRLSHSSAEDQRRPQQPQDLLFLSRPLHQPEGGCHPEIWSTRALSTSQREVPS